MKTLSLIFTCTALMLAACRKHETTTGVLACITKEINKMKAEPVTNPAGRVLQYEYNGQTVYYIPAAGCCDMASVLYDSHCNVICSPDGGLTGAGDGRCSDFFANRKNEKLIWEDDRK